MSKSLLESAAEILNTTVGKDQEPMKKGAGATELGGETPTESDLDNLGARSAAATNQNPPPAAKADPKAVKVQAMEEVEADEVELTEEEIDEYINSLSEEELAEFAASLQEEESSETTEEITEEEVIEPELTEEQIAEARKNAIKDMVQKNMSSCAEDVDALFNGESLSEEFRTKATTIFEAAVRARVEAIANQMVEEHEQVLENTVVEIEEQLSNQVDEYLNYVVENWMTENKLAVETGLRAEIAEDFMAGLKDLFVEHYIEVPEDKADLVEAMAEQVATVEAKLEEQTNLLENTTKALNEAKAQEILRKTCDGLTEMQVAKIKALAEGVEFTTEGEYTEKLAVIRESYFPSGKPSKQAAPQVVVETQESEGATNSLMDYYVNAITKQLPK